MADGKSLVWACFWTRTMGKSYDLLALTVEGGIFFGPFLDQDYGDVI